MQSRLEGTNVAVADSNPKLYSFGARLAKAAGCFFAMRRGANRGRQNVVFANTGKIMVAGA